MSADSATYSPSLRKRLQAALKAKGPGYHPRTEHLLDDGTPRYTNRLILEDSPYLLQHAHNPVDWHAWGEEAFAAARRENRPIFLSIGYATCHWCHVMERESFENLEIAEWLNRNFIAIKVDRELLPDVDATYMMAVMLMTGHGGWPMSSFLTPDGKTFLGGTYFPPDRFLRLLRRVSAAWDGSQPELEQQAERVAQAVRQAMSSRGKARELGDTVVEQAVTKILARHDDLQGGFSQAPKFPNEPLLFLLLDAAERNGDGELLDALEITLGAMAGGGIYDQVGGGFHRYSTDNEWLVPHFEKMLYNQAHLARIYLRAWRLRGRPLYARVARQILDYVLRDMTAPGGGFYSATDADSEGEEGRFFLWTPEQLLTVLGAERAALARELFDVTESGNFEDRTILNLPISLEEYAEQKGIPLPDLVAKVEDIRRELYRARERREHPLRDDKIITAWNGMMIGALASAAEIFGDSRYRDGASKAAEFIWRENRRDSGELWRAHLHGSSSVAAGQEDYAYLAEGLLALYDVTGERHWLERAKEIADKMLVKFWDDQAGGFFMGSGDTQLNSMARPKEASDGATPSGNSVALRVLSRLARRTGEERYRDWANATLSAFSAMIEGHPEGFAYLLMGAAELNHGELGGRQYAARGAVPVRVRITEDGKVGGELRVELEIQPGWHVNGHQPLQENLIPTVLSLDSGASAWKLGAVEYPQPEILQLGFQQQPLALYQGKVEIRAGLERTSPDAKDSPHLAPVRLR
ncbi:MAG: thioredoxin domain-containing protein, partial [Gammaproteobacteria bacterium]|nr:thioredoxin domain-containing protein [Gammaproteobacteria bacterium]